MAKVRVYELAKELGVTSKVVLTRLNDMGEFVRSASSTIEAPVVRRLAEDFEKNPPAKKRAAKKAAPAGDKPTTAKAPDAPAAGQDEQDKQADRQAVTPAEPARMPAPEPAEVKVEAPAPVETPVAEPQAPQAPQTQAPAELRTPAAPSVKPGPRPGPRPVPGPRKSAETPREPDRQAPEAPDAPAVEAPAARAETPADPAAPQTARSATPRPGPGGPGGTPRPSGPRPGAPRPGNNPFSSTQGMQRGGRSGGGQGGSQRPPAGRGQAPDRPRRDGGVPGAPRPNPAMMPKSSSGTFSGRPSGPGGGGGGGGGGRGRPGGGPGGPGAGPRGGGGGGGYRGGPGGGPGGPPGGGGRPGAGGRGRGGTQGAFGRPGGPARRGRKSKRAKRQEFDNMQAPAVGGVRVKHGDGETVRLARGASLTDFAEKVGADPASLVQVLFHLGEMVTATQSVNDETLQLLGEELNYSIEIVSPEDEDRELLESFSLEFGENEGDESALMPRPPVVTVMGHVDHGKTKLLDAIRHANVVDKEAGGITQHIGAYQVATEVDGNERKITFIDTPGHETFTAMRARGAKSSDIAVLVVAADDGVMPQTIEALNHAKAANVPMVVAVNKIDKPGADPSKVRGQLTEYGLVPEEYGGDTMFVDVSAKSRLGIEDLLESIVLTADASLDLRANPDQDAQGIAIEAHLDRGRGPVATVLVQRGTLRVGDSVVVGPAYGRVRAMLDEYGDNVDVAPPSRPVLVLGLTAVPGAGDNFLAVSDDRVARQIAEKREARERNAQLAQRSGRRTLEEFMSSMEKGETAELLLIIKGDVSGSVEALEDALAKIDVGEDVNLRVIHRGVGAINQNDVNLATVDNAVIIGFNVRPEGKVAELAEREGVDVRYYSVIYAVIDDIEAALKGMLKPEFEEHQLGTAEIREIFRSSRIGNIAGCMVTGGIIRRNAKARLLRDGSVVADNLDLASLRREKDDVAEVREGFECGLVLAGYGDIKIGDVVQSFEMREIPRT